MSSIWVEPTSPYTLSSRRCLTDISFVSSNSSSRRTRRVIATNYVRLPTTFRRHRPTAFNLRHHLAGRQPLELNFSPHHPPSPTLTPRSTRRFRQPSSDSVTSKPSRQVSSRNSARLPRARQGSTVSSRSSDGRFPNRKSS